MQLPEMLKTKWQPGMQGGLYETIDHLITQHNALCDYLAEREKPTYTTSGLAQTEPIVISGNGGSPTTPDRPLNQERE